jgi:hypothetical protein
MNSPVGCRAWRGRAADLGRANDLLECDQVCALASFALLNFSATKRDKAHGLGEFEEAR